MVYPIFKNGKSSLFNYAEEKKLNILKNQQLQDIKQNIKVFLRDPVERFISGLHTIIETEKISNVDIFLQDVESLKICNRHYIPQFFWLIHLFVHFKGVVEIIPINNLYDVVPNRNGPPITMLDNNRRKQILSIDNKAYVAVDYKLINKYMGQTIELEKIIREFKSAVS